MVAEVLAGRSGVPCPARAKIFLFFRLHNSSGAHPAAYLLGNRNSFPWDKAEGDVKLTNHPI
jgi:hypothetical protein